MAIVSIKGTKATVGSTHFYAYSIHGEPYVSLHSTEEKVPRGVEVTADQAEEIAHMLMYLAQVSRQITSQVTCNPPDYREDKGIFIDFCKESDCIGVLIAFIANNYDAPTRDTVLDYLRNQGYLDRTAKNSVEDAEDKGFIKETSPDDRGKTTYLLTEEGYNYLRDRCRYA